MIPTHGVPVTMAPAIRQRKLRARLRGSLDAQHRIARCCFAENIVECRCGWTGPALTDGQAVAFRDHRRSFGLSASEPNR